MSYEAYVHHILQKHRLAVSLAVIKTKPENKTLEEHIQQLRNNMISEAETCNIDVDNLSLCSDDFFIGETNDFSINIDDNNVWDDDFTQVNEDIDGYNVNNVDASNKPDVNINLEGNNKKIPTMQSQRINNEINEQNEMNDIEMVDTHNLNDSVTILENFADAKDIEEIDTIIKEKSKLDDVLDILRGIDDNMTNMEKAATNQITTKPHTEDFFMTQPSQEIDLTQCFIDIDATLCESLDISETANGHALSQKYNYNFSEGAIDSKKEQEAKRSIESVSHTESIKDNNIRINNTKNSAVNIETKLQNDSKEKGMDQVQRSITEITDRKTSNLKDYRHTKEFKNVYKNVANIFDTKSEKDFKKITPKSSDTTKALDKSRDTTKPSQEIVKSNLTQDFTCNTHYSESQMDNIIVIDEKYIHGAKRNIGIQNKEDLNNKKTKKDSVDVKSKIRKSTKKAVTNIKNISTDNEVTLPEIQFKKAKAVKDDNSQKVIEIYQNDKEMTISEANTRIIACTLLESQKTTCSTSSYSNQIFEQNSQNTFALIRNNRSTANDVQTRNNTLNASDTMLYVNNDSLYNKNSSLHSIDKTLKAYDKVISSNTLENNNFTSNAVQAKNNTLLDANDTMLYVNKNSRHCIDKTLNANDTVTSNKTIAKPANNMLYANNTNITNKSDNDVFIVNNSNNATTYPNDTISNTNNSNQNINDKVIVVDEDLFSQESQPLCPNMTDAFETNIDSFGFLKLTAENANNNRLKSNDSMTCMNNDTLYNREDSMYANNRISNFANNSMFRRNNETLSVNNLLATDILNKAQASNKIAENPAKNIGFSQNTEIQSYRKNGDETTSKDCADFNENFDSMLGSQPRYINFDNTQEVRTIENNKKDTTKTENQNGSTNFNNAKSMSVTECQNNQTYEHTNMTEEGCTISDDNFEEDVTDKEVEKIPFKIIKELNKVKLFLNKRNDKCLSGKGYSSSDTGYRSDSSSRNSLILSQSLSGVDQSAHSLFNYISECPLDSATQDIIEDISVVLGQLIDQLHEEEKYPSFLDDLLQSIPKLLTKIRQQDYEEDMLTTNDEIIHRIILVNKSKHVQKYTIEKITNILENFHSELTTNESYEIQNVDIVENMCYIFHILENILTAYNRSSQNLSQSTQNFTQSTQNFNQSKQNLSQSTQNLTQNTQEDEKLLKKSNIMDIWRKKWNPNFKENPIEGSQDKVCAIINCNAVLNKLIVGCMEGYSLISYFALKCFNVTQS